MSFIPDTKSRYAGDEGDFAPLSCSRRDWLRRSTFAVVAAMGWSGLACHDIVDTRPGAMLDFSTESGPMNFVYALTQLQFNFYTLIGGVGTGRYVGMTAGELTGFNTGVLQTQVDRNVLSQLIKDRRITDGIQFQFISALSFQVRAQALGAAQLISESAANGYVGIRPSLTTPAFTAQVDSMIATATARATTVRAMLGLGPLTPSAGDPVAIVEALRPFFLTNVEIANV